MFTALYGTVLLLFVRVNLNVKAYQSMLYKQIKTKITFLTFSNRTIKNKYFSND